MNITDIDFGRLYRSHYVAANMTPKSPDTWDQRAAEMSGRVRKSRYTDEFIDRMDLAGADMLLDIGCGAGTICLPLADRLRRVIGLDFSQRMLDGLLDNAAALGHDNVEALRLAWEDDWSAVPACDIEAALHKLHDKAKRRSR